MEHTSKAKGLPQAPHTSPALPDHRIMGDRDHNASMHVRSEKENFIGTLNVNTLSKEGKELKLIEIMENLNIQIFAIQETRYSDENEIEIGNYKILKGKPAVRNERNARQFGTAFVVRNTVKILGLESPSEKISVLTVELNTVTCSLINAHAPTEVHNKNDPEKVEIFWDVLDEFTRRIPKDYVKILLGDFNAQVGGENEYKDTVGRYPVYDKTNVNGKYLVDFCQILGLRLMSTRYNKPKEEKETWKSPNPSLGEFQIDHVAVSEKYMGDILEVRVLKNVYDSDHHLTRVRLGFSFNGSGPKCCGFPRINSKKYGEKFPQNMAKEVSARCPGQRNRKIRSHGKYRTIEEQDIPKEVVERHGNFLREILQLQFSFNKSLLSTIKENLSSYKTSKSFTSLPPTKEEITEIIQSLKKSKTSRGDSITAEMIQKFHNQLTEFWESETIRQYWKYSLIYTFHEEIGGSIPENCKFSFPVTYRILSKALLNRLEEQTDGSIGEYQVGFRKGRSRKEQIWNLKMILKIRRNMMVTFVKFKRTYDSVDRQTIFDTLKELGVDGKTRKLIRETLTNITSKVKFLGEISEPFDTHTGVPQGDDLFSFLFNLVLDKVIKEWEKNVKGISIGNLDCERNLKCLAFADNLAIITSRKETKDAIEKLHEIASKAGLHIWYEKTHYMENQNLKSKKAPLESKYGTISPVKSFKFLGEIILPSGLDSEANLRRATKLKKAYGPAWKYYHESNGSLDEKLRHYKTVVLPKVLYASETTSLGGRSHIFEIERQERKFLRKIYGSGEETGICIKRTADLYTETEMFGDIVRKRRLKFYGEILRMDENRIAKRLLNFIKSKKGKINWMKEIKEDLKEMKITEDTVRNRTAFEAVVTNHEFRKKLKNRAGRKWSEERKQKQREIMRERWRIKKSQITPEITSGIGVNSQQVP